jgi:hypothetical protein
MCDARDIIWLKSSCVSTHEIGQWLGIALSRRARPRSRREPSRDGGKLRDCSFRLRGFARRPLLGVGELALQAFVLGLQGLDVRFEDVQTRRGRGAGHKGRHQPTSLRFSEG